MNENDPLFNKTYYTIGYGNRSFENFLELLKRYKINKVADIRSKPYSKFNPNFQKKKLQNKLLAQQIPYLFLGKELGGYPKDSAFYEENKVNYQKLAQAEFFIQGLETLASWKSPNDNIVLLCSELNPIYCHRVHLIGKVLLTQQCQVFHIDEASSLITQQEIENLLIF